MITTLIVLAKRPVAGRVKTRLCPPLTAETAADVAAAALADTLRSIDRTPAARRLLAFDVSPGGWLPPGWEFSRQTGGGLDRRIVHAFESAAPGPAVLVGMDTPQLRPAHLSVFDVANFDACLGLAPDGGYWAIGFRDPRHARAAVLDVAMSTTHTAEHQLERLARLGLRVQLLDALTDVDTIDDAHAVADQAPGTAFARALHRATAWAATA